MSSRSSRAASPRGYISFKGLPLIDGKYGVMRRERTFQELIDITRKVIHAFEHVEQRPWTIEVTMIELMKQIGDLSKHIMMMEKYYLPDRATDPAYMTTTDDSSDELADVLYCLIRIEEH